MPSPPPEPPPGASPPTVPPSLRRLADAFLSVQASLSVEQTIERVTEAARGLFGAEQAAGWVSLGPDRRDAVTAVATAERLVSRHDVQAPFANAGLGRLVRDSNAPLRLNRAELAAHPATANGGASLPRSGWLAAPLADRDGRNIGLVELCHQAGGDFTSEDEALLVQLTQLASVALQNAGEYRRQAQTAQELQRRLLPHAIPTLDGLDVAVRYVSAGEETEVGGDWYDVISLGAHRVGLVIGDVMGRGVQAASVMGQLRVGLRAYALDGLSPGRVLQRLARLVHSLGGEYLVTVVYAIWDLDSGSLTFSTAGHLPPLLRTPEGTVTFLEGDPGVPIGVSEGPEYAEHRLDGPAGATFLLYTDGLVERRDVPLERTLEALVGVARTQRGRASDLADGALAAAGDLDAGDDIAVLVASRPGRSGGAGRAEVDDSLTVAPDPAAVRRARRWLVSGVAADVGIDTLDTLRLLASEVITNAVVHAATPITITVHRRDSLLRVCVTDEQGRMPSVARFSEDRAGGRGMGLVEALADSWGVDFAEHTKTVWFELRVP